MTLPPEHTALLARRDFPVPHGGDFAPAERDLLTRYGRWMEGLATGRLPAVTAEQQRFVQAARGECEPLTDFERVWAKLVQHRAEVAACFASLAHARANAAAVEAEYTASRSAVLSAVRDRLAEVDAAFADRLRAAMEAVAASEATVRDLVLRLEQTVRLAGVQVAYHPGRVTWDNERMEQFAQAHPEVRNFRRVGKPWVSLRYLDADALRVPRPLPPGADTESPSLPAPSPDEELGAGG
jgi:uncharacterized protein YifE (UPF0438 family)